MNDLSNFWEEQKKQEKKSQNVNKTSAKMPSPTDSHISHSTNHVDAKVRTSSSKSPVVEKTKQQLPSLPSEPKRALLAAGILLVFGVLIGTNLPRRDSGFKVLSDIKKDIGEEAKLAGTTLAKPELAEGNESSGAAVLGTAETSEGKIKVLSANLVGIWQKTKTDNQKPSFEDKKNSASASKDSPEASNSAKVKPSESPDKEATPNQSSGVTQESGTEQESAAISKSSLEPRTPNPKPELRLVGVRILGEIKNVGASTVYAANVFVRFYGTKKKSDALHEMESIALNNNNSLLAIKVAGWNQGYKFLPLAPGEIGVYDAVVPNPPEFETVTIEMKPNPTVKKSSFVTDILKVKSKALEPTTLQQKGQQINYFTFNGTLVNTGKVEIVNPAIYVWVKNKTGKIIGFAAKTLASDLLPPDQDLSVSLFVIPTTTDDMFSYEVQTFGEKL